VCRAGEGSDIVAPLWRLKTTMKNTRRQFIERAAGAVAAGAWALPGLAGPAEVAGPRVRFPAAAKERLAVASYPFRSVIQGFGEAAKESPHPQMELKDFAAHVIDKFHVSKIEPWSWHFRSIEKGYLEELRATVEKAGGAIANIAVDGAHSVYSKDAAERDKAVEHAREWIDAAVTIGSPSIRAHIARAKDSEPEVERAAESLRRVADYGAKKNVVIHLENDDAVSEDPFYVVKVIEKAGTPWLRALPDFANTVTTGKGEYAYEAITAMFAHAYGICHVKEVETDDAGKEFRADLPRTFGILKHSGYKGYCSIEWDSPGDPYQGTVGLIEKAVKYLS
jgi:sugar phosphate isomerase/epimerase